MDTVIMAVRVALLILVTGTFTAIWSGDHPDQMAAVDRPRRIVVGQQTISQQDDCHPACQSRTGQSTRSGEYSGQSDAVGKIASLPPGISAGTYLVADQFGQTQIRIVTEQEAAAIAKMERQTLVDHYLVTLGDARWHYIRIDQAVPDRMATSRPSTQSVR